MTLELNDCTFSGPAIPEPFAKFELEKYLKKAKLLPKVTGKDGKELRDFWQTYRRKLRRLGETGGGVRVLNHVISPLAPVLGYEAPERQEKVSTREGMEDGGWLLRTKDGKAHLRVWSLEVEDDLDAPTKRGYAYRFSPSRIAQRVLLSQNERVGLMSDGLELRILICDPARPDSFISIRLDRNGGWRSASSIPDSFQLLFALVCPKGLETIVELTDQARLTQTQVTAKLREQAKNAIRLFIQELLDNPANQEKLQAYGTPQELAKELWREGLILVYRLLFILKLESSPDPARAFSFASNSIWRNSFSPNTALAKHARPVLDSGAETGSLLESGLRVLFRLFAEGMTSSELKISAMGGMLFGDDSTQLIDSLPCWGERAVALLLDQLLWTPVGKKMERQRVHYGSLDVEDLGRVYEALLELEPGISTEPMCRLKRQKLEVVVPTEQGERYRKQKGKKSKVEWVEGIPEGQFYLRVGLGRKSTGSYYTPHPFVRFLVQETLGPQVEERSPASDPHPGEILKLKVLDPAMGSGHFLVEACRFLGDSLYEACRKCDDEAIIAEEQASRAKSESKMQELLSRAQELRKRVEDLPDPDDEMLKYLPSRAPEGEASGYSQKKAEAIARRLIAVHCLYGVDKNPLAVELAKLSLWLESYAEGLPLTFMDHRLICGDSLTGPFFEHLLTRPSTRESIEGLFVQGLRDRLASTLKEALSNVKELEGTVAKDVADVEAKRLAKKRLDDGLAPFLALARVWCGGVMLGDESNDVGYERLLVAVAEQKSISEVLDKESKLKGMAGVGHESVSFPFVFPEVFHVSKTEESGFDAVLGNPPWDAIQFKSKEFLAAFNLEILDAPTKLERADVERRLLADANIAKLFSVHKNEFELMKRSNDRLFEYQKVTIGGDLAGRQLDAFRVFMERNAQLLRVRGFTGVLVPSAFHANAGATGVRQLYLEKMALHCCFSFENRKKLFDIDSRFKFAAVVACNESTGTEKFNCGFYWHDLERLFNQQEPLTYSLEFVRSTGGEHLTLLEATTLEDARTMNAVVSRQTPTGEWCDSHSLKFYTAEMHMSHDAHRFTPLSGFSASSTFDYSTLDDIHRNGAFPLFEGKSFFQFDSALAGGARYAIPLQKLVDRPNWMRCVQHYRLAYRNISASTNERTMVAVILPALSVTSEKAPSEKSPWERPTVAALVTAAVWNSYPFDYFLRPKVASTVNLFLLRGVFFPRTLKPHLWSLLAHSALRLSCSHAGFSQLWKEQLGSNWRESRSSNLTWPVISGDDARWTVRAAIDAVVAEAYGLSRDQYQHVLSTFSHKSYPKAPELCLAMFDELKSIGIEAFCEKHDPYWDIPLVEKVPEPVFELPIPAKSNDQVMGSGRRLNAVQNELFSAVKKGGGKKR